MIVITHRVVLNMKEKKDLVIKVAGNSESELWPISVLFFLWQGTHPDDSLLHMP